MNYIKQFLIILGITFLGEILKAVLPLPVPASIYGMLILLIALMTGVLKLESIKAVSKFLIEIMPLMFIPAGVGLMASWDVLSPMLASVVIIVFVTLLTVLGVSGWVAQLVIRRDRKKEETHV